MQILWNLPLILSDTKDPADVSLNRTVTVIVAMMVIVSPLATILFLPEWFDRLTPYWEKLLLFLGAQTAANVYKKG